MSSGSGKRYSVLKKILIGVLILLVLAAIAFQIFVTKYLPPIVRQKLEDIIVKGSDSLYRFEMGKFDLSVWGGSVRFADLHIMIDSTRYAQLQKENELPGITMNLDLKSGSIEGIGIWDLLFSKKIDVRLINFREADVKLARHFRTTATAVRTRNIPLWKLIQPDINSIQVRGVQFDKLKVEYQNVDSAKSFRWNFDDCNAIFTGIKIDSVSAQDTSRLLFAKNIHLTANDINMKTPDGLYNLKVKNISYSSSQKSMDVKQFNFAPAISEAQFMQHFGYQHELYRLSMPVISIRNFQLAQWISYNRLLIDTITLASPQITVHMDRNIRPNPYSKKGKFPHQLLGKAPFTILVKRLNASDATITYTEKNDKNKLTGKVVFQGARGTITNITNDTAALARSPHCMVEVNSGLMKSGKVHTVFRLNQADPAGAFSVNATITNLDAPQLQPLFKAMTSTDLQSFNMRWMEYSLIGNENNGTGRLRMKYDDMDILLNKVADDHSFNKRGFLSFLANRLVIYKENPMKDGEERIAESIPVQRDAMKSFFNFIWKTLYSGAGEIVLRPVVQRKIEKRKERALRKAAK